MRDAAVSPTATFRAAPLFLVIDILVLRMLGLRCIFTWVSSPQAALALVKIAIPSGWRFFFGVPRSVSIRGAVALAFRYSLGLSSPFLMRRKNMLRRTLRPVVLVFVALLLWSFASAVQANYVTAVPASGGDGQSVSSGYDAGGNDFIEIGGAPPIDVRYDPDAGPWIKLIDFLNQNVQVVTIIENLHVVGPAWTDWHEEESHPIPGWSWLPGSSMDAKNPGGDLVIDNLEGAVSADGQQLDFLFPDTPLSECSTVSIVKQLVWQGAGQNPGSVRIKEWPTVPEPSTVVMLLCVGLVGLYLWRRHR